MAVRDAGAVQWLPGPARFFAESGPSLIGPITLDAKHAGERSAGNPPAAFDVAGAGNVTTAAGPASAKTLEHPPAPQVGAPDLDTRAGAAMVRLPRPLASSSRGAPAARWSR